MMKHALLAYAMTFGSAVFAAQPLPCEGDSAFGQTLGSTDLKGEIKFRGPNSALYTSSVPFPPYDNFEAGLSAKSGRIWSVGGDASLETEEAAQEFAAELTKQYDDANIVTEKKNNPPSTELYTGKSTVKGSSFGKPVIYRMDGLRISITSYKKTVMVICADIALETQHIKEALGKK